MHNNSIYKTVNYAKNNLTCYTSYTSALLKFLFQRRFLTVLKIIATFSRAEIIYT